MKVTWLYLEHGNDEIRKMKFGECYKHAMKIFL